MKTLSILVLALVGVCASGTMFVAYVNVSFVFYETRSLPTP